MSAEKWESVTWDWIEREIVDYLLIANDRPGKSPEASLARVLVNRVDKASATPARSGTQRRRAGNV